MSIHYQDDALTLHHGSADDVLPTLDAGSVDCIVTSPPYYGLRDYGVDGQLGAEGTPSAFVERLVRIMREARRALADDGTLWLNLGDSYQSSGGIVGVGKNARVGSTLRQATGRTRPRSGLPAKNLLGIPWRSALALQDDGWILRNDVIWSKPNAMPESVRDRLSNRHEHLFLLTKSSRYWFNLDPIREPLARPEALTEGIVFGGKNTDVGRRRGAVYGKAAGTNLQPTGARHTAAHAAGRNPGDVWMIPTQPFPGAHFAVMPPALAERCILAGCKPGGTVLDPFSGSGTTGAMAAKHGRCYVGIDLNADYLDLSLRTRLQQPGIPFGGAA